MIANYVRTVEAAFAALGPGQRELFRPDQPPPVEIVEGAADPDRIPTGNPRAGEALTSVTGPSRPESRRA